MPPNSTKPPAKRVRVAPWRGLGATPAGVARVHTRVVASKRCTLLVYVPAYPPKTARTGPLDAHATLDAGCGALPEVATRDQAPELRSSACMSLRHLLRVPAAQPPKMYSVCSTRCEQWLPRGEGGVPVEGKTLHSACSSWNSSC